MKDIRMEDILEQIKLLHPNLPQQKIKEIIKEGCKNMTEQIKQNKDIQIKARKNAVLFQVFKPHSNK
jgi:hypothetical protein